MIFLSAAFRVLFSTLYETVEMRVPFLNCPLNLFSLYFSTLCVYFYTERQKVINQAKEMVKRDVSVNSTGVGDGQQGNCPSASTNESTQPNQTNQPKQPKPNTSGSSKKKTPNLKVST